MSLEDLKLAPEEITRLQNLLLADRAKSDAQKGEVSLLRDFPNDNLEERFALLQRTNPKLTEERLVEILDSFVMGAKYAISVGAAAACVGIIVGVVTLTGVGFKLSDVNERGMHFLRFGDDHHSYVLAAMSDEEKKKGVGGTLLQQIALEVDGLDTLKQIRKYLLSHKVNVRSVIKHEGPGSDYTFDFDDPEGNRLQFFSDMDKIGWDGKSRPMDQWNRFDVED